MKPLRGVARKGIDRRLLDLIKRRFVLCEREDGVQRLVAFLATSKDRTFIGFESWPNGEGYTSCTFEPRPVRRAQQQAGKWKVGRWTLRPLSYTAEEDNDTCQASIDLSIFEAENKRDFDGLMDMAEQVLADHVFD